MKNFLVILLAISVITTIAGCTFRQSKVNDVTSENPATLASTPKSSDASMPEESKTDDVMESSKVNLLMLKLLGTMHQMNWKENIIGSKLKLKVVE